MPQTTDPRPDADLSNCDREAIQFPAAVQPHMALLVLDEATSRIVQASANSDRLLGQAAQTLIGLALDQVLGKDDAVKVVEALARERIAETPTHLTRVLTNGIALDVFAHRVDGLLLLECELAGGDDHATRQLYHGTRAALGRLQLTTSLRGFFTEAVDCIRELTGFDRVLAYRFAADGSGEVIAEAVAGDREPYLGLHYPASDIPAPARRLFALSWLRLLPRVEYAPVPIVPPVAAGRDRPLDLSYALSRSVSTMYSGYLRNMGVQASMVMPLTRDGVLWGLISCLHHDGPRHVPHDRRMACEFLAHSVSLMMASKEDADQASERLRLAGVHERLVGRMLADERLAAALTDGSPGLLDHIRADGAAVCSAGEVTTVGLTPPIETIRRIANALAAQPHNLLATDHLAERLPWAEDHRQTASGLLWTRLVEGGADGILLFRGEYRRTVTWHGNPNKPVETIADGVIGTRLMPRTSFALWQESMVGRSQPWLTSEIDAAQNLRRAIVDLVGRHVDELRRLNERLTRSNAELESFAYVAGHDLKEPLRGINNYANLLARSHRDTLDGQGREHLDTIIRLTRRMDELLESLLVYARLGRTNLDLQMIDLNDVVDQVRDVLSLRIAESNAMLTVPRPLPTMRCDRVRVVEALANLVSNAIKYNDQPRPSIEIAWSEGPPLTIRVRDDGIGIEPKLHDRVFQIFRRLHERDRYGGGTGVGLTITRRIIERHGGRIWLESEPGRGSTFSFTLAQNDQS